MLASLKYPFGISFIWMAYFYSVILCGVEPKWRLVTGRDPNVNVNVLQRFR